MKTPLTPLEFARRARRLYSDCEALVDGGLRLSYEQFFDRCDRWSHALQELGVKQGDHVAYISPNTHAMLESFYAVPQIGAVTVPINYRLTVDDFKFIINHSGATVVCVHSDYIKMVDSIRDQLADVQHFVALEGEMDGWIDYEAKISSADAGYEKPQIQEDDLISINYTSGTTAKPKGVMITHRNAYLNIVGTLLHFPVAQDDIYLWTLPMFHANGWTFVWINTARGAKHICLRVVDHKMIFGLIEKEKVSLMCAAPTILIGLANAPEEYRPNPKQSVRLLTAGAPPAAATIELIEGELGWEITQVYGLTETAPLITVCEELPVHRKLSLQERARIKARQGVELITSGELRVVDENEREVAHDGETLGEITVRGNVVMQGYYREPEITADVMRGGWFHTGDTAVVHPDQYIEIRDRFKDVIISGGENVSSVEVEGVLLRHPSVQEVAVVGMAHKKWGERPHAFVVLKAGESATQEQLKQMARDNLAHFKAPEWVTFVDELPKTATGKIKKYILRKGHSAISKQ